MGNLLQIDFNQLDQLFPFHLLIDENLHIHSCGRSWSKLDPTLKGRAVFEKLQPEPSTLSFLDFPSFTNYRNKVLHLKHRDDESLRFRFQVLTFEKEKLILLAGSVWTTETEILEKNHLEPSDFAPHNTTTEMIQVIHDKEVLMDGMKELMENYLQQKNEILHFKEQLHTIINSIPTGLLVENTERKIIYSNQLFCDLFGIPLTPEQMIGFDCQNAAEQSSSLFENETAFITDINRLLEFNQPKFGDILQMKDGKVLERDFIPIFRDGVKSGLIWQYKDVTQLKMSDLILQQNEEKYKGLLESLEFGLLEVDLEGKITKAYFSFCRLTGYSKEELYGQNAAELLLYPEDEEILRIESAKRKEKISSAYEVRLVKKDGSVLWALVSGAPLLNLKNEIIGSIGIHWDITLQKKKEEELRIAKDVVEKSSNAKKEFMAKMSHELRTPLNVIQGMTQLLKNTDLNEEQLEDLHTITESSNHLLNLVNDLLDIAKIESGKITLSQKEFSFKNLILECTTQHYHRAREKGLRLNLKLHPNASVHVLGDEMKIKQIITNLLTNAIKFTEKGDVNFEVEFIEQQFRLIISDTGIGIPLTMQKNIFEPFTQATEETSRKYGGTGLGLSITRELVEMMGGKIELSSQPNFGSKFTVTLPLSIVQEKLIDTGANDSTVNSLSLEKVRILVAEDNPLNQKLIRKILTDWKCDFEIVENGAFALEKLETYQFDILLLDVLMPVMDGITTIQHIRNKEAKDAPRLRVIGLTAQGSQEEKLNCLKAGMNAFINKPFSIQHLKEEIHRQLNHPLTFKGINLDFFHSNGIHDEDMIRSMAISYRETTSEMMKVINHALNTNDLQKAKLEIHSLKSNAQLFGIKELSVLLEGLEWNTHSDQQQLDKILSSINTLYYESLRELENHFKIR